MSEDVQPVRRRCEAGASAVEYGLLVAAIAAIIVVIVFALGKITQGSYATTCSNLKTQMQSSQSCTPCMTTRR